MNNNYNNNYNTREIKGFIDRIHKKQDRNGRDYLLVVLKSKEFGSKGEGIFVFSGRERGEKELEENQKYIFIVKDGTNKPDMNVLVEAKKVVGVDDL